MTSGTSHSYHGAGSGWARTAAISLAIVALVVGGIILLTRKSSVSQSSSKAPITVLCAAGMKKSVYEIKELYEKEYGLPVNLTYGSSGQLEGQLRIQAEGGVNQADLYIPADSIFADRTRREGLTAESLDLAEFHVVLAVSQEFKHSVKSVQDLLALDIPFTYCDTKAGAGLLTAQALRKAGIWEQIESSAKVVFPTVTEAANAIKSSRQIQAGFIWDSVAHQFNLEFFELPELSGAKARISANVVASSGHPEKALHFARYLAAPDRGNEVFARNHFQPVPGDKWSDQPAILVFSGGVNRDAVDTTIREFEAREGCKVQVQYAGCGTLVGAIQTGAQGLPNVFLTCDASYLDKVEDQFGDAADVSSTEIMILVRKGNPMGIQSLADLNNPAIRIGTTDPQLSTLGFLSWELFKKYGVHESILANKSVVVTTATAHELIAQVQSHGKLDAALVYKANCQNLTGDFELIQIHDPTAIATQNIASAINNPFPHLSARLIQTITSQKSAERFSQNGFHWLGNEP